LLTINRLELEKKTFNSLRKIRCYVSVAPHM
jgi:hypothetical protein